MAIAEGDIKLLKSEVMLDTDDGGGYLTSNEIVDGVSNNMFPDISELDRTYGRVSLRKCYAAVLTTNTDSYYGVNAIVSKSPVDPNVSVTLFTTKSWSDRRTDARDRIEAYLARGPRWSGHLLETQITGQRAIQLALRPTDAEPNVGQGLVLLSNEGLSTEVEQYVRVTKVSSVDRYFTVIVGSGSQDLLRRVCTVEISEPLRYTFAGPTVQAFENSQVALPASTAFVRDTVVANAAVYYGISNLQTPRNIGDSTIQAESIFTQLVPSSQSEIPMGDLSAGSLVFIGIAAASTSVTVSLNALISQGKKMYVGSPVQPGTMSVLAGSAITDDSNGSLYQSGLQVGSIEYDKGILTFNPNYTGNYQGMIPVTFVPGANPTRLADTASIAVGQENRGYNYVVTVFPPPVPGSLNVSYTAQGKNYYLYDQGAGAIKGTDSAFGSGVVNYGTGTIVMTCGALPDAGSEIIFAWGKKVSTFVRTSIPVPGVEIRLTTAKPNIAANSLHITWKEGDLDFEAHDNGTGGIVGRATGTVNYTQGTIKMTPGVLPQKGTVFTVTYDVGVAKEFSTNPLRQVDGSIQLYIPNDNGNADIIPGSVELRWDLAIPNYNTEVGAGLGTPLISPPTGTAAEAYAYDVPNGGAGNGVGTGMWRRDGVFQAGFVNYDSGLVGFTPEVPTQIYIPFFEWVDTGEKTTVTVNTGGGVGIGTTVKTSPVLRYQMTRWDLAAVNATYPFDNSGTVTLKWREVGALDSNEETYTLPNIVFDLTFGYAESIVPGSVRMVVGTETYVDLLGLGTLYHAVNAQNGAGIVGGTVDYASGKVILTDWNPGSSNTITMQGLSTETTPAPVDQVVFRCPVAPVRPSSFQIRVLQLGSTTGQVIVTADSTGKIEHPGISGYIDYASGVVRVFFQEKVLVTDDVRAEPWYDESLSFVEGTGNAQARYFLAPRPVYADSILYNAVGYTYIPLDADILGLDAVRLPSDGRVPIFRVGDTVVVHHTDQTVFSSPAIGQTVNVGRTRVASIRLVDVTGKYFPSTMYTNNPDAGTLTLLPTFSMTGYTAPIYAEHRIEDMALCSDVQINGQMQLTRTLTHAFPSGSKVSSALIISDIQARVYNRMAQTSWTNEWSDSLIGTAPIANYNGVQYPPRTTNKGALEERWALIFTSSTSFRIVGEQVGQIGVGDTNTTLAPVNPATNAPYFELDALGWGSGWAAGNVLRFNTAACNYPIWAARTVLQGPATEDSDSFSLQIRGDIDRV
jgi:hypothetical protein